MDHEVSILKGTAERVYIVGRGPSLEFLTKEHFGEGIVIALNRAIVKVNTLKLPNKVYSMQKDGEWEMMKFHQECNRDCYNCILPLHPVDPGKATLLVNYQSIHCFPDKERIVMSRDRHSEKFGDTRNPSALVAIRMAKWMGAKEIIMMCCDALSGDFRDHDPVTGVTSLFDGVTGYDQIAIRTQQELKGIKHQFILPHED